MYKVIIPKRSFKALETAESYIWKKNDSVSSSLIRKAHIREVF